MTFKRRDNKHLKIKKALEDHGIYVMDMADLGHGKPDLLAVRKDKTVILFEVKSPYETLTPAEMKFHKEYPGEIAIIQTEEEALKYAL